VQQFLIETLRLFEIDSGKRYVMNDDSVSAADVQVSAR
jgi:hypothetical protein